MKRPEPSDISFRFKIPRQERIHRRLRLVGFAPAAYYRDACRLATVNPPLESITHLLGHLFREIEGMLIKFLLDETDREALTNQDDARKKKIRAVLKKLDVHDEQEILDRWLESESLHKYAHRSGVISPRPAEADFHEMLQEREEILDYVLQCYESHYTQYHRRLDALLRVPKPTRKLMTELSNYVPNNIVSLTSFFERLTDAEWLPFLNKKGFFRGPSEPEPDPETGDAMFPRWPAGGYLIRMAGVKPREVMDILLEVNDKYNPYVQSALIKAATQMPPEESARLVPKVKGWLKIRRTRSLMSMCPDLIGYLARCGRTDESLDLVRKLLSISPFADDSSASSHDAIWDYDYVLKRITPAVVDTSGLKALKLFCDLLEEAMNLACGNTQEKNGHDDSHTWRERIEQSPTRGFHEFQNSLVTGVRDASVTLTRNDPGMLASVIDELEGRYWLVFRRLALHVLCEFPNESPELTLSRLKEFSRYDNPHFHNEYYRLARTAFPLLLPSDRRELVTAILAGPDIGEVRRWLEERSQKDSDEAVQRVIRNEVRNRLGELRSVLNESEMDSLAELERELGPAVPLVNPLTSHVTWGPSEPQEGHELESMGVGDIVAFLQRWGPSTDGQYRSYDKVCKKLRQAIMSDPERFSRDMHHFRHVDPTYLRHVFQALGDTLQAQEPRYFTWDNVIGLCRWVASQGREIAERTDTFNWDPDWGYTRRAIVDFVDAGLKIFLGGIPFTLRDQVWGILEPLTRDPEPTTEYERRMIGVRQEPLPLAGGGPDRDSHMRPGYVASNTMRCLAVTAAVSYGMWVKPNLSQAESADQETHLGFEAMPELREVLDYHLDFQNDSSLGMAYVYGKEFPYLYSLDPGWAEVNKDRIFSKAARDLEHGAFAWEGFLLNWPAYQDLFDLLLEQYEQAVGELGRSASESGHFVNLDLRLGQHLCELYLSGKIILGSPGSLWERFFDKADNEIIGELMLSAGWTLFEEEEFSGRWLHRLRTLWDWRLGQIAADGDLGAHSTELRAFGAWFGSGKLDDAWALERLREVLMRSDQVETGDEVDKRLADLMAGFPVEVLECAILLVRGATKAWKLQIWNEDLKWIIDAASRVGDRNVCNRMAKNWKAFCCPKGSRHLLDISGCGARAPTCSPVLDLLMP